MPDIKTALLKSNDITIPDFMNNIPVSNRCLRPGEALLCLEYNNSIFLVDGLKRRQGIMEKNEIAPCIIFSGVSENPQTVFGFLLLKRLAANNFRASTLGEHLAYSLAESQYNITFRKLSASDQAALEVFRSLSPDAQCFFSGIFNGLKPAHGLGRMKKETAEKFFSIFSAVRDDYYLLRPVFSLLERACIINPEKTGAVLENFSANKAEITGFRQALLGIINPGAAADLEKFESLKKKFRERSRGKISITGSDLLEAECAEISVRIKSLQDAEFAAEFFTAERSELEELLQLYR
ncbi:MAG: hypothetical protein A2096_04620 [Spirochaetes bacterium GWF1_41_5]|nr:MAG: hypothetical protein A2096_04620 [Spirochaetes bacterium GWF1_41_5]